jgi:hypothetical protein
MIKARRMRLMGHVARIREKQNTYRLLLGKAAGKRPLERPRRWWVDNIKMDLRDIAWGWCGLDWSVSGWGQVESFVNAVMNLWVA